MTAQTIAPSMRGQMRQGFRLAGPVLCVGLLCLGLLFHTEDAAAVGVWLNSTAYNHCFLIIPIVAYLLWDRRDLLAVATPLPNPWFALAAIPASVAWLLAERLGIMEARQLVVMTLVEVFLLSVLGWRLFYRLAGPLLYLYFLVPFGAFITPWLQGITTSFVVNGLDLLNIPNYSDGYAIEIPEGSFLVAEACAGLRFLIASIAFGYLYAMLLYRSPGRRGLFMLASIVVPIIANGFRALGIVVLGHVLGNAQAAVADHLIYGWIFFSVVILLLIALGLPFRQDRRPPVGAPLAAPLAAPLGAPLGARVGSPVGTRVGSPVGSQIAPSEAASAARAQRPNTGRERLDPPRGGRHARCPSAPPAIASAGTGRTDPILVEDGRPDDDGAIAFGNSGRIRGGRRRRAGDRGRRARRRHAAQPGTRHRLARHVAAARLCRRLHHQSRPSDGAAGRHRQDLGRAPEMRERRIHAAP